MDFRLPPLLRCAPLLAIPALLLSTLTGCDNSNETPPPPNVLFILADDLGYSDLGAFGSEIHTPNLDTLAAEGRLLLQHHSGQTCAPTRAMIMAGTDQHVTGISEQGGVAGTVLDYQAGHPGYEGYLNERSLVLPKLLHDAGYHTYMTGKWNLGADDGQRPKARGFEQSFALLNAYGYHWGPRAGQVLPAQDSSFIYTANDVPVALDENYFSTREFTNRMIGFLDLPREDGKPFFAYLAYTSPHWPLLATDEFLDRYAGQYDEGYEVIRERRFERQLALGIVPPGTLEASLRPAAEVATWDELTDEQKKIEARRMEIYAAMVEEMDYHIGRLIQHLKQIGEYDNTLIWFQSDNGAESNDRNYAASTTYDNSYANLGRYGSFVTYGTRWAEVSASPLWLFKSTPGEGGISVPAIVRMPHQSRSESPLNVLTSVQDVLPTLLELAHVPNPGSEYDGQDVNPITGYSMAAALEDRSSTVRPAGTVLAGEQSDRRYVRKDNWKLVRLEAPYGTGDWQLFDLDQNTTETTDLATERPDKVEELKADWDNYVETFGVILPPTDTEAVTPSARVVPGELAEGRP